MARNTTKTEGEGEDTQADGIAAQTKRVMLVCDHVHLPADLGRPDWMTAEDTRRYEGKTEDGKRARLVMHAGLADFLASRDQAELLD